MDLEERIARLIDPRPWNQETAWWIFATHQQTREELVAEAQEQTRVAARRVIDGLHLQQDIFRTYAGNPVHHLIRGNIDDQEDM